MNTQATTPAKSTKEQAQSMAVTAVKVIVYPAHLVCQTAADLLCIGQAQAINKIDGTPVFQSMMEQQSWTQEQQAKVVGAGMKLKDKWDRQREANRQQDAARLRAKLDKIEGVEHIVSKEPIVVNTEVPVSEYLTPGPISALKEKVIVPAPPVEKKQSTMAKAMAKADERMNNVVQNIPLMTQAAAFSNEPALQQ